MSDPAGEAAVDAIIQASADGLREKHPPAVLSPRSRMERAMQRASRDRDALDKLERQRRPPMRYRDGQGPQVVLPPGSSR